MHKLVDKYILQQFTVKIFMTLIAFVVIFLLVDIVDHLDRIMDSDMPNLEIIRYYFHSLPWYVSLGLPMSLLLATVFTLGILQKNNELSALKSSGISIRRLSIPLLILGVLFSIFSFYFENLYVTDHLQKRNELGIKYNLIRSNSNKMKKNISEIRLFLGKRMYNHAKIRNMTDKHKKIIENLYQFYNENKLKIPQRWVNETYKNSKVDRRQMIIDYISGMTDRYILNIYKKI